MRAFDDYFRNGLIHEGRIKSGGQFSYSYTFLYFENGFLIINPRILQQEVTDYFERYLMQLVQHEGAYQIFYNKFFRQFNTEIQEL
ncbi:MAG: hypothetical protein IPO01_16600 [Chitinophagaceae bacterium]|nr:hypothetical protein [Chitinophagaceae bacterium]